MSHPVLVGIAGGSASGKTSLARRLAEEVGEDHAVLMTLDDYYLPAPSDPDAKGQVNFDHPKAFDWPLLRTQVTALMGGVPVEAPRYDHRVSDRRRDTVLVEPRSLVLLEGILALWDGELRRQMDIKVFVDTPADVRLLRRLRRDTYERGRSLDHVLQQYEQQVRPMHEEFCAPTRVHADVIIPRGAHNRVAVEMVRARLLSLLDPEERRRLRQP